MIKNKIKLTAKLIIWFFSVLIAWFSLTSFSMFILEEAVQSVGFGLYAIKGADNMTRIEVLVLAVEQKNRIMAQYQVLRELNPISAWLSFDLYFQSVEFQFQVYERIYQ